MNTNDQHENIGAPIGERVTVKVENDFGAINMNFLIHGLYSFEQRNKIVRN
jgi:hypothetical protein